MSSPLSGKRARSATPPEDSCVKRTKVDDDVEDMLRVSEDLHVRSHSYSANYELADEPVMRDEAYYLADGSCVLQVAHTLFNVHRTLLAKDGSLFSTMFELPQGDHEAEGRCDESPIHLQGESVSEFKNFLWVLYALPHELADITGPQIDLIRVNRLIDIAKVSFKYHFRSLETWALDVINDRVTKSPPSIFYLPTVPMMSSGSIIPQSLSPTTPSVSSPQIIASNGALVSRLMRLAQLCGHERLLNTMISVCKQLMGYSIQYAHLAMTLADELDLRALRGIAYFEVMQKGNVVVAHAQTQPRDSPDSSPPPIVDAEGRLIVTHAQKLRLLTGYYRLTMVWERFRATPLTFEHSTACGATWHQHGCTQCWLDFWKEKTKSDALLSLGLADVLGRLRAIVKEFVKWGSATYMHQDCRTAVRKLIQEKIKAVEDELPDYFDEGLSSI